MQSWKTTVGGTGMIVCQIGAVIWPQWSAKWLSIGAILAGVGLMAAQDYKKETPKP